MTVPAGSIAIEDTFETYYSTVGVPYDDTQFSGRSDYQAFINKGIPSSGLFTGAEVLKTRSRRRSGVARPARPSTSATTRPATPSTTSNTDAVDVNVDAIAFAVLTYAYSTEAVNGVPGIPVPGKFTTAPIAGEEGTFRAETMARTAAAAAPVDPHARVDS